MLKSLAIQNVVLIDKAEIDFSEKPVGLCILTGETGSGKSILLDAFGLAIGFRSNLRLIGSHEDKASVNAEFDISQNQNCRAILQEHNLLDAENPSELRIRRLVQENSSSKVYVNDQAIGVNLLAQIGETLVEIHGQHDQRGLLNPAYHGIILDEFSDNFDLLSKIKKVYEDLKNCDKKIFEFEEKKSQALREKDYLTYIIKELEDSDIKHGEENDLITKKDQLTGKEKILNFINELKANLLESNSNLIAAQKILLRGQNIIGNYLADKQEDFDKINEEIDKHNSSLDQSISEIEVVEKNLKNNEESLEEVEERLFHIRSLARKFNVTVDELPKIISDAKEKLFILENESEAAHSLAQEREKLFAQYQKIADQLSEKRKKSALKLSKKVEEELQFLKMENVKFHVDFLKSEDYSANGYDKIKFSASINKNDFDEIAKIASGGELSRFMLALKVALMEIKSAPTMIFDEIDTGIGGSTADAVGKRLKILSQKLQILVVTHQAQIAAKADLHFRINKIQDKGKIKTVIKKLSAEEKNHEIARMISGEEITGEALAAAKILQQK